MKAFLLVAALAVLFVLGPVLAMRPSPRQAQLARLRARATAAGLRVRVSGAPGPDAVVDYVLPWRIEDLQAVRGLRLRIERGGDGPGEADRPGAARAEALRAVWHALPAGVSVLKSVDEGLAAQWNEKGRDEDVDRIREALLRLREALLGSGPAQA